MPIVDNPFVLFPASANIAINNIQTGTGSTTSLTLSSYTLTAGSNRVLVVMSHSEDSPVAAISGIDFGTGNALTLLDDLDSPAGFSNQSIWYMLETDFPGTETQDIIITFDASTSENGAFAFTLTDASQTAPAAAQIQTSNGASTGPADDTITPASANSLLINYLSAGDASQFSISAGSEAGAVEGGELTGGSAAGVFAHVLATDTSSKTMGFDKDGGGSPNRWIQQLIAWESA